MCIRRRSALLLVAALAGMIGTSANAAKTGTPKKAAAHGVRVVAPDMETVWQACAAARDGDLETLKKLLDAHPELINCKAEYRDLMNFALMADQPSKAVVLLLLDRGYDVNKKDEVGETPIYLAMSHDSVSAEIVELLISRGAKVNAKTADGKTALMVCRTDPALVELLIKNGADVKAVDNNALSVLQTLLYNKPPFYLYDPAAVKTFLDSRRKCFTLILDAGADINHGARNGEPLLAEAISQYDAGLVRLLIDRGADVKGNTKVLWRSAPYGWPGEEIALMLLENGAIPSTGVLHMASGAKAVARLLGVGLKLEAKDKTGRTPLHYTALRLLAGLIAKSPTQTPDDTEFFTSQQPGGSSPGLDSRGSDERDSGMPTQKPTEATVRFVRDDVLDPFLNRGANVNAVDSLGRTPLHYAVGLRGILSLFEGPGNELHGDNSCQMMVPPAQMAFLIVERYLSAGANPNAKDRFGRTPLHYADQAVTIGMLIAKGANVNAVDKDGRTPLHYACDNPIGGSGPIRELLKSKPALNVQDKRGQTALHLVVEDQHFASVPAAKLLLAAGAKFNIKNKKGKTAYDYALASDDSRLIDVFKAYGATKSNAKKK